MAKDDFPEGLLRGRRHTLSRLRLLSLTVRLAKVAHLLFSCLWAWADRGSAVGDSTEEICNIW